MKLLVLLRPWTLLLALAPTAWGIASPAWASEYGGTDPPTAPVVTPPNGGGAVIWLEDILDDAIQLMATVSVLAR